MNADKRKVLDQLIVRGFVVAADQESPAKYKLTGKAQQLLRRARRWTKRRLTRSDAVRGEGLRSPPLPPSPLVDRATVRVVVVVVVEIADRLPVGTEMMKLSGFLNARVARGGAVNLISRARAPWPP